MWEWLTVNSMWLLLASTSSLIVIVVLWHRIHNRIDSFLAKSHPKLVKAERIFIWVLVVLGLVVIGVSFTGVAQAREGGSAITGEAVRSWILAHGIYILVVLFISYLLYRFIAAMLPSIIERSIKVRVRGRRAREEQAKRAQTLSGVLSGTVAVIIGTAAVLTVLSEVGINIAPLLAGAGVLGIAIGFGAQSLIKDVFRGFLILVQDQYNKGDVVKIAGISGLVEDVNLWRTVMRDLDGIVHSIPNGEVTTASNFTKDWSRVNINIPVAYGEDLDHVIEVLNKIGSELAEDKDFGPMIIGAPRALRVENFGESAIEIKVLAETKPLKQWDVMGELRRRVKKTFDEEGIEIPWPHVKLYFGDAPSVRTLACLACSQMNTPDSRFCSNCGASLKQKKKSSSDE